MLDVSKTSMKPRKMPDNDVMTGERIANLELEVDGMKSRQDDMLRLQKQISESLIANSTTQQHIASTLSKMETAIGDSRTFQIRAEEARKADQDHRARFDRRMDNIQRDLVQIVKDHGTNVDKLWNHIRHSDRENLDKIHKIETDLKVGGVHVDSNKKSVESINIKSWQILFWIVTTLIAFGLGSR